MRRSTLGSWTCPLLLAEGESPLRLHAMGLWTFTGCGTIVPSPRWPLPFHCAGRSMGRPEGAPPALAAPGVAYADGGEEEEARGLMGLCGLQRRDLPRLSWFQQKNCFRAHST